MFSLFSFLRQKPINVFERFFVFFLFFSFFFFYFVFFLCYWYILSNNRMKITNCFFIFLICCKIKEKKKLDTKEFLRKQRETKISEGYNLINGAKLWYQMMRTSWLRNPHAKTPIPGKPSKSGLIGVWHKDNLYLGTSTIENEDPHPTNIDSQMISIRIWHHEDNCSSISRFSVL